MRRQGFYLIYHRITHLGRKNILIAHAQYVHSDTTSVGSSFMLRESMIDLNTSFPKISLRKKQIQLKAQSTIVQLEGGSAGMIRSHQHRTVNEHTLRKLFQRKSQLYSQ